MLSKVIKDMIEQKFGHPVRYPKDCDILSLKISEVCKTAISGSTLKRLFGFTKIKGAEQPRLYTLDIISTYIGYKCWEELSEKMLRGDLVTNFSELQELLPEKNRRGECFLLGYEPRKELLLTYIGKSRFQVTSSNDNRITAGDILTISTAALHYPLLITEIIHAEKNSGQYIAGKISGITCIRKLKGEKPKKK